MNSLPVNFPVAPPTAMPEPLQTIFFWLTMVLALAVFGYSVFVANRHRSAVPVLMVIAAGAAIVLEPIVGFAGHVVHPVEGSIRMFETFTRVIPWHMFFAYVAAFGLVYLVIFHGMIANNISPRLVWLTCAVSISLYILVEIYPVQAGLWVYYDDQPLWLWKGMAPLTWSFMNTACEIMGAALIFLLLPYLNGWKQLLVIPLGPIGALMGHFGAGWPMYSVINSAAAESNLLVQLSGIATIGMALLVMWISATILTQERPQ